MKVRTAFIDDEQHARENLIALCNRFCPEIEVLWEASSVQSARAQLEQQPPDLIFLDLMLGDGTGFELLSGFESISWKIIFTTAYDTFALKAFEFHAIDYLLKPIDPDLLQKAVSHASSLLSTAQQLMQLKSLKESHQKQELDRIFLPNQDGFSIIKVEDILYIEADGNYATIRTKGKAALVSKTIKELSEILPSNTFFRPHQSFLINLNHVTGFSREDGGFILLQDQFRVPVARRRKQELMTQLQGLL